MSCSEELNYLSWLEAALEGGAAIEEVGATQKQHPDHPEESMAASVEASLSSTDSVSEPPAALEGEPTPTEHKEAVSAKTEEAKGDSSQPYKNTAYCNC